MKNPNLTPTAPKAPTSGALRFNRPGPPVGSDAASQPRPRGQDVKPTPRPMPPLPIPRPTSPPAVDLHGFQPRDRVPVLGRADPRAQRYFGDRYQQRHPGIQGQDPVPGGYVPTDAPPTPPITVRPRPDVIPRTTAAAYMNPGGPRPIDPRLQPWAQGPNPSGPQVPIPDPRIPSPGPIDSNELSMAVNDAMAQRQPTAQPATMTGEPELRDGYPDGGGDLRDGYPEGGGGATVEYGDPSKAPGPPAPEAPQVPQYATPDQVQALTPGQEAETEHGTAYRTPDGRLRVRLNEQGRALMQQATQQKAAKFKPHPFISDPRAPQRPVVPGKPDYDPFNSEWHT